MIIFIFFSFILIAFFSLAKNVGIGTLAPASLLHVNGALQLGFALSTTGPSIF